MKQCPLATYEYCNAPRVKNLKHDATIIMTEHAHVPIHPLFFLLPFLVCGNFFQVYGWGVTEENGFDLAEKLQELEVSIQYAGQGNIPNTNISQHINI